MLRVLLAQWAMVAAAFALCGSHALSCFAAESPPFRNSDELEDGQWLTAAKDYANTRYSGLGEISKDNVAQLQVAWTFSTGINRGQEAAPLVVGKTMYVATPYPNILYALDLADGSMKWKYEAKPAAIAQGVACCDFVTRGAAYWDGTVIINSLDAHTIGVDAETGQQRWKTKLGEVRLGETMTMAPFVVDGRVYVGNSGADFGVRGWLACLDAKDGKILWRAYSTGPDKDCLIGDDFKPFYASDKGKDLGVKSWPPGRWQTGGGRAWGWVSYDPELKLIYYGTSNPAPWNSHERPGDNKWTSGIFARNAENGSARWFYQYSPHDLWDHDGINESLVLDLEINGQKRKVLVHPDRNGYMYVMDRTTGEVLSATAFVRINATKEVDLKTGRLIYSEDKQPEVGKVIRDVAPSVPGGKDWTPSAYSPKTGWLYIPHLNMTMDLEEVDVNYVAGLPYIGVNEKFYAGPEGHAGEFTAWDPVKAKAVWQLHERFPVWSGALVTAGDVVFYGTLEGWFKAVDAHTGKLLWKFKTGSGICGQPITYRGPDGRQYVAVLSGVGGWAGVVVSGGLDTRDPNGANGFVNAMKELPKFTTKGGTLYVFALPASQKDSEAKP